mgnify:CR=1 FL=1
MLKSINKVRRQVALSQKRPLFWVCSIATGHFYVKTHCSLWRFIVNLKCQVFSSWAIPEHTPLNICIGVQAVNRLFFSILTFKTLKRKISSTHWSNTWISANGQNIEQLRKISCKFDDNDDLWMCYWLIDHKRVENYWKLKMKNFKHSFYCIVFASHNVVQALFFTFCNFCQTC